MDTDDLFNSISQTNLIRILLEFVQVDQVQSKEFNPLQYLPL
jgi:hypothetical protein